MPPLRQRSDREQLLQHLLTEESRGQALRLDADARQALLDFAWPGNVRQLRNVLRTLAALCDGDRISLGDLPAEIRQPKRVLMPLVEQPLDAAERSTLLAILEQQHWHMSRTAEQLGVSRNTLYRKLHKHGIERP